MCHQWLRLGAETSLILPTIWRKRCRVSLLAAHAASGIDGNGVASPASDITPPSPSWPPLPVIPHLLLGTGPGLIPCRGMECCVALVEQVSATAVPSLGAHDPLVPARVGLAGDGAAEPTPGPPSIARSRSPRTNPRRARNLDTGCPASAAWWLACWDGDESQQPIWPQPAQRRRWNHQPSEARHSTHPEPLGVTEVSIRSSFAIDHPFPRFSWRFGPGLSMSAPAMTPPPPVPAVDCHQSTYGPL